MTGTRRLLGNSKGGLSVTALWMLALVSILATGLMRSVLLELRLDAYTLRQAEATWLARAGVQHAIAVLKAETQIDSVDSDASLDQTWKDDLLSFRRVACGNGFFDVGYATDSEYLGLTHVYGILDENRKININRAPQGVLLRLPGMTEEKVVALQDWIDADDETRQGGAENDYYRRLAHPYACKNADLEFLEELSLVRGFSAEDIRMIKPLGTVYGTEGVNLNTAAPEVLAVLGFDYDTAKAISAVRWGSDGRPFTRDDEVFTRRENIPETILQLMKLTAGEQALVHRLVTEKMLGVRSSHFLISSAGTTLSGEVRKQISATVHRVSAEQVEIMAWDEHGLD